MFWKAGEGYLGVSINRGQHLIGQVLGSCLLEKLLGHGGSSAVFLAQQQSPERKVAVKVFLPRRLMDARMQREFYLRFLREAEAASKLEHPNILPIYSYGEQDGLPYIVMPYMEGGTLAEYMAKHALLSLQETLWYLEQIAAALDYAHEHGCIHCDVKPANILLDQDGYALLSDFGIARVKLSEEETLEPAGSKRGKAVLGTPDYISPEQALGRQVDGRSDIYSLGVMLFSMLAKRLPFHADSSIALALLHVHEPPPSLRALRADITPELDAVVLKALAKDPAQRFQTAQELCSAFARAIAQAKEIHEEDETLVLRCLVSRAPRPHSPRPAFFRLAPALAVVTALLLILIGGLLITSQPTLPSSSKQSIPGIQHVPSATVGKTAVDYLEQHDDWPSSSTFFYDMQQGYHILNKSAKNVALALYDGQQFTNFRLRVTMDEIHSLRNSAGYYGVVFRCSADQSRYYLFEIATSGIEQYDFLRYDGQWKHLANGRAVGVMNSNGQHNTISVEANEDTFVFQINGKAVGSPVKDASKMPLTAGQIGLYVEDEGMEVAFSHLYIDAL